MMTLAILILPVAVIVGDAGGSERDARVTRACAFLDSLYNPSVHLVRETLSNQTYWIASDNLLAQQALQECGSSNAQSIQAILNNATCCQQGNDHMHESLFGRSIPLPIHNATTYTVTGFWKNLTNSQETDNYTIDWEYHNSTGTLSPYYYGDIATYTLLEYKRRNNETGAQDMIQVLNTMWTGTGIADEPYKQSGIYQTYKTALYAYALTQSSIPVPATVTAALLRMQGPDGGFHTGYGTNMTYAGTDENAETTSIAIIALSPTLVPPSSLPALIAVTTSIALLLVLIVLRIVLRRQSKQSSAPSSRKTARQGLERRLLQSKLPDGRQY